MQGTIPISFEYEGIQFDGHFTSKGGYGFDRYHLVLNGVNYGSLVTANTGWYWSSGPQRLFEDAYMLQYFISIIKEGDQ